LSSSFCIEQRVFYINGEVASIINIDYADKMHSYYTIEVNGTEMNGVHHTDYLKFIPQSIRYWMSSTYTMRLITFSRKIILQ